MHFCYACGAVGVELAHVKDRAVMKGRNHDFNNVIPLCAHHHREYFDRKKMAICLRTNQFALLVRMQPKEFEVIDSLKRLVVDPEYVAWKNAACHSYLKAWIRKNCPCE